MNRQFRYYARYSNQCELLEFANTDISNLMEVELNNNSYKDKNIEYIFDDVNSLSNIIIYLGDGKIDINFMPSFDIEKDLQGTFRISPKERMGYITGIYEIKRSNEKAFIRLIPQEGWKAVPNSSITKMILKPNSIFCGWSKNYEYLEEIDFKKKIVKSEWKNNN